MKNACCLFGHRDLYVDIEKELKDILEELINEKGVGVFYTGGVGDSDAMFSTSVHQKKLKHRETQLILVKPYFSIELNTNKEYYE